MTTELTKAAPNNHGPIYETDLYDFAGWLTTRPGVMAVGSSCEAGPMAEAVGEYIKTFPERFALTQRPAAQTERGEFDCGLMPLIEDYAKAVHDGDDALCQVLRQTIEASLPAPQQATPEPVGEPVGTVVHATLNGQTKPWVTVALNQDADLPDGTKLYTHPAPGVPEPSINWFGTHFTYKNQPCDNLTCWRLGEAARNAKPGGDLIDHGLSLLHELEKHGYGVFALAAAQAKTANHKDQPTALKGNHD